MLCHERGMALISVMLLLAMLLALVHILCDKVWQTTRQAAVAASREKLFWAAQSGIEEARHKLAETYLDSFGWSRYLTAVTPFNYPSTPVWQTLSNGMTVEIFLRDNQDGDDDHRRDNDLKIYVLGRAKGGRGNEVIIECLCGFNPLPANVATSGEREDRSLFPELSELPMNRFVLPD